MKLFLNFLTEARVSQASETAARQQLTGDGHGNWYDKDGNRVAVTKKGRLEMLSKKEKSQSPEADEEPKQKQSQQQDLQQMPVQHLKVFHILVFHFLLIG